MSTTISFIRLIFVMISVLFCSVYTTTVWPGEFTPLSLGLGVVGGAAIAMAFIFVDRLCLRINLRTWNIAMLGLFFGYLLGQAVVLILSAVLDVSQINLAGEGQTLLRAVIFLITAYLGMIIALRSTEEIHLSIPYVKFHSAAQKRKEMIVDISALSDSRIIDLATSGLLDNQLLIPRFILKELYKNLESLDENIKGKARRSLDVLKKLEAIPLLNMKYLDTDFPEVSDAFSKTIRLTRMQNANMLTADMNRIQQATIESSEGIRIVNLQTLSNALKPLTQSGEELEIKIQRYGKEPGQGVGYLEDGTMVVVNGGAEFIGKTIKCHVLSVKHTSSGRMIFCNAQDDFDEEEEIRHIGRKEPHRSYFALER